MPDDQPWSLILNSGVHHTQISFIANLVNAWILHMCNEDWEMRPWPSLADLVNFRFWSDFHIILWSVTIWFKWQLQTRTLNFQLHSDQRTTLILDSELDYNILKFESEPKSELALAAVAQIHFTIRVKSWDRLTFEKHCKLTQTSIPNLLKAEFDQGTYTEFEVRLR